MQFDIIPSVFPKSISAGKWDLDDAEVTNLIENLISYALIRDEYRKEVKER